MKVILALLAGLILTNFAFGQESSSYEERRRAAIQRELDKQFPPYIYKDPYYSFKRAWRKMGLRGQFIPVDRNHANIGDWKCGSYSEVSDDGGFETITCYDSRGRSKSYTW